MKLWIVGKQGLLATALRTECHERQHRYAATSREEVNILDLQEVRDFMESFQPTHILNAAAYTQVDLAEKEKDAAYALNVTGVENLVYAAQKYGAKLVHFSTDYVFSGQQSIPYREGDLPRPINYYGETKFLGEQAIWKHLENGLVLRTSWLFGRTGNNFVSKIKYLMGKHKTLSIVKDQFGRPTFAEDLAKAALSLLDHAGLYHFANRGEGSWFDLAGEILLHLQKEQDIICREIKPIATEEYPTLARRPKFSVLATEKIEKEGIRIRPWREALQDALRIEKERKI